MSETQTILRVDATYDLAVKVGDTVQRGERLSRSPEPGASSKTPMTGVVASIQFDPGRHEFVIVIARAQ